MKSMRKLLTVGLLLTTLSAFAGDKVVMAKEGALTISTQDKMVQLSILNTQAIKYTLNIRNAQGETIHTEVLGKEKSLGRLFDFSTAPRTTYSFHLIGSNGEQFTYTVRTGSWK